MRTTIPLASFLIGINTAASQSGQYRNLKIKNALIARKHHRRAAARELFSNDVGHNAECNRYFNDLNLNSDGVITMDELKQILPKLNNEEGHNLIEIMQSMDSDGNNEVAQAEFMQACLYTCEDQFNDLDVNDDNLLTVDDFKENLQELGWSTQDINGELDGLSPDDSLNVKEFCSAEKMRENATKKTALRKKTNTAESQTVECACSMLWDPVICNGEQFSNVGCAACSGYADYECYPAEEELCACSALYDPVICNGEHFSNIGCAACGGYSEDQCYSEVVVEDCVCSFEWDPVYCNGQEFGNMCEAECNGYLESDCSSECICTSQYDPVYCNGIQFGNMCDAACNGYQESDCSPECICTSQYDPVYCNGQQFGNMCDAECNGFQESDCSSECICTSEYDPVYCNGQEFGNMCDAGCNGFQESDCSPECMCPTNYDPVYCNGQEFGNMCAAACNGYQESDCASSDCICPTIYDPVYCNGVEFGNMCDAQCNGYQEEDCV